MVLSVKYLLSLKINIKSKQMSAEITANSQSDSASASTSASGGGETFYHIKLLLDGHTYLSKRRYSQFLSFHSFLKETFKSNILEIDDLPPKNSFLKLFNSITLNKGGMVNFIKEREGSLNDYVKKLSQNASPIFWKHPRVMEFFNIKNMTNFPLKDWNILLEKVDILLSSSPLVGGEIEKENREKIDSFLTLLFEGLEYHKVNSSSKIYTEMSNQYKRITKLNSMTTQDNKLDCEFVFDGQVTQEQTQEQKLNLLSQRLKAHKSLGLAIEEEVNQQNKLIDSLKEQAENTNNKMGIADSRMKRINGK